MMPQKIVGLKREAVSCSALLGGELPGHWLRLNLDVRAERFDYGLCTRLKLRGIDVVTGAFCKLIDAGTQIDEWRNVAAKPLSVNKMRLNEGVALMGEDGKAFEVAPGVPLRTPLCVHDALGRDAKLHATIEGAQAEEDEEGPYRPDSWVVERPKVVQRPVPEQRYHTDSEEHQRLPYPDPRFEHLAAQRTAAKLRPRVILPRYVSISAARTAEARGRQLQRLVGLHATHPRWRQ